MSEALCTLLGDDAKGLSANVVGRLKEVWVTEYKTCTGVRAEDSNGQCLLVIIGVRPDGTRERVALGEGFAETKEAWLAAHY